MQNNEVGLFQTIRIMVRALKLADGILRNEKLRDTLKTACLPKHYLENDSKKDEGSVVWISREGFHSSNGVRYRE